MAERQKKKKGQPESPVPNMIFDQIQVMAYMYADREEWDNYILAEMQSIIDKYGAYVSLSSMVFPKVGVRCCIVGRMTVNIHREKFLVFCDNLAKTAVTREYQLYCQVLFALIVLLIRFKKF